MALDNITGVIRRRLQEAHQLHSYLGQHMGLIIIVYIALLLIPSQN